MTRFLPRFVACVLLVIPLGAAAERAPWVGGEAAVAREPAAAPRLRLGTGAKARALPARVELAAPDAADLAALRARNQSTRAKAKRVAIGLTRPLEGLARTRGGDLAWVAADRGMAAQASVTSSGAASMRMAIALAGVPADVEMVFFGSADPSRLFGPVRVGDIADRTQPWWSPLTEGETQTVEFYAPAGSATAARSLAITAAGHLFAGPSSGFTKLVADIGSSGACNVDVPCSPLVTRLPFQDAVGAVAQMLMSLPDAQFLCTGTLLNDSDPATQVPWFFSANHCFDNEHPPYKTPAEMQAVANTLTTIWHFEASACHSSGVNPAWRQVSGGAQFLFGSPQLDALFLRLNNAPPAGSFFLGWDSATLPAGTAVTVLHHPEGDLKKVSLGSLLRFSALGVGGGSIPFYEVAYNSGTTEPGSSGAAILSNDGAQYLVRGALWGGNASCEAITASDFYSRFDLIYPSISQYLGAKTSAVNYTDLWWGGDSQSGWGLNLIQHPSRTIFGVWYTYDASGRRTWYVLPDVRANSAGTAYTGTIYATSGPPATAAVFDPDRVMPRAVGTGTLNFSDANNGTFAFSIDGVSGAKSITRQPF
jgi:hypothetical protein